MNTRSATTLIGYSLLAAAAGVSFILPGDLGLGPSTGYGASTPDVIRLNGTVWDFQATHSDFASADSLTPGHVAGLVDYNLGADGTPTFDGSGNMVTGQAQDASGNYIAPVLANAGQAKGVAFSISNGKVVPSEQFVAKLTVIGAAMETPFAGMRVTCRLKVGTTTVDPWGLWTNSANNIHDANNPRHYVMSTPMAAGTAMSVAAKSYYSYNNSPWTLLATTDSATSGTSWIKVLKNGDSVPNIAPFATQASITTFLQPYINATTKKVTIASNQAIFLFELATNDSTKEYCDFQDLVCIITMAKGPDAFVPGPPVPTCGPVNDIEATTSGTATTAGIKNATSFKQWFNDSLGNNLSATMPLDLYRTSGSTYVFDDKTDPRYSKLGGFYPADDRMYGDIDGSGHNEFFTYSFEANFTYDQLANQYFEVRSDCEIWVFIDGKLVIDMGGIHSALEQRIDLSRLCLQQGKTYRLQFFMANRYAPQSSLRLETNMVFNGEPVIAASALGD